MYSGFDTAVAFSRPADLIKRKHVSVNLRAIKGADRITLNAVREEPNSPGILDTPRQVAKTLVARFSGLQDDPSLHPRELFPEWHNEMILDRDIPFSSMCEPHLLPFNGVAQVGYIPDVRVSDLSKPARVVDEAPRRPHVQERMTQAIDEVLESDLKTAAAVVVTEAEHSCIAIRDTKKSESLTVTSSVRGSSKDKLQRQRSYGSHS